MGVAAETEANGADTADVMGAGPLDAFSDDAGPTTVELCPHDAMPNTNANIGKTEHL